MASASAAPAPLARGATVGRYVVLEKLGGGGMGVVYTAYDPELDRKIAIKLLRPSASSAEAARTRLVREAQALARLSHPNVIAVHDVGDFGDQVFVAMEYVEGQTLHAWIQGERRPWREVRDAYLQAGRGIAAAHAASIVHRDFKPENVLIGNDGRVRVLDFGLAREDEAAARPDPNMKVEHAETVARSAGGLSTPLTSAGEFLGTPAYSSPEQLEGDAADARSDQFSFCVALYEALFGARPFRGATFGELLMNVLDGKIEAAPARSAVPSRIREVLLRGLRGKPEERYASMEDLLSALAYDPAVARRRVAIAAGALAVVSSIAFIAWDRTHSATTPCRGTATRLTGIWDAAKRNEVSRALLATGDAFAPDATERVAHLLDDYAQHWTTMSTEACVATRVRGEQSDEALDLRQLCLDKRLGALDATTQLLAHPDEKIVQNAVVLAMRLPPIADCADLAQLRAQVKPPSDPTIRAEVAGFERQIAKSRQLAEAEKLADATAALPSLDAVRALHYRPLEASLLLTRGLIEYHGADLKRSVDTLTDGIVAAEAAGDDKSALAGWLDFMGDVADMHRLDEARLAGRHAGALLERIGGDPRLEAKLLIYQGWTEVYDDKDGSSYMKRALELRERTLPPDDPDLLESIELEARKLASAHEYDKAIAMHQRVLAGREHLYGKNAPLIAWSLFGIGTVQRKQGDDRAAISTLRSALAIYQSQRIDMVAPRLFVLESLALAEARAGERAQAIEHAKLAVEQGETLAHTRQPADLAMALGTYATVLRTLGDPAGALAQAERSLVVVDKALPPTSTLFVQWLTELALDRLALGRASDALEPLERAVKIVEDSHRQSGWNGDQPAQAWFALARTLRALGKDDARARELASKARAFWEPWGKGKASEIADVDAFLASASR